MKILNVIWWLVFIFCAVTAQSIFVGFDFLIIGFVILLQEADIKQFSILAPIFLLIHEGMSTFPFGSIMLWYISAFGVMVLSNWLFETKNFLFMFLFSSILSFLYIGVYVLMSQLQGVEYFIPELMDNSVIQALIMPILWWLILLIRPSKVEDPVVL